MESELAREGTEPLSLHHIIEHVIHRLRYRQVDPFVTRCDTMANVQEVRLAPGSRAPPRS
jgi:hypothetical protein